MNNKALHKNTPHNIRLQKTSLRRSALCIAMGLCLASLAPSAFAQDGAVVGRSAAGAQVTVRNPETGFTRRVTADAEGNYRFPFLPVGEYTLEATRDGVAVEQPRVLTVSLGTTTNVAATVSADGVSTLGTVQVIGTRVINLVDVSSTESATNITQEELERLPVARDATAVALLAPGVNAGDDNFGSGSISFGGSSVAENTVYINGLNVTDFYRRQGFSSIPFGFFKEFQIKTGGYSVEFGRTTGGVINTVTQSGTNEFRYGAQAVWTPSFLRTTGTDRNFANGDNIILRYDESDRLNVNGYASGPIIRDRLFFYAMYEARDFDAINVSNDLNDYTRTTADVPFWGTKLDWQINDNNLLELLAFSDENEVVSREYGFDPETERRVGEPNTSFSHSGGINWALTYTSYLTDSLSMKLMYGENDRERRAFGQDDVECDILSDNRGGGTARGCASGTVLSAVDTREAARADFEWQLGDHLLRFGLDREVNTSDTTQNYPGSGVSFRLDDATPGAPLNGSFVPPGATATVLARSVAIGGVFETLNTAYYLEDNWSITPDLILNAGLRLEAFDNKNSDGESYIKIDDMLAPRFGFSWDMKGDGTTKLFGNIGRYFLPVANVINIKQAGGFLDERRYYVLAGLENFEFNGQTYQRPILGDQIGTVDNSQGDGTVGDLRGEVDADMDPVFQDELILGFQSMIDEKWSWGVRGIYRRLHNAIDDMQISDSGFCHENLQGRRYTRVPTYVDYVMGNPGKTLTVYVDTDCDGVADSFTDIDTSKDGWALYDDDGNYVGQRGYVDPRRTYKALELVIDRAWDEKWAFNAAYTLSYSEGNAEGPVNSDIGGGFLDAGRTENFDSPYVNLNSDGPLPNDRRHQFKFRGSYAITDNWLVGGTLTAQSGRPISPYGSGNPFDSREYFSRYICVENCTSTVPSERVFELVRRGSYGRLPWTFDLGASISYLRPLGTANLRVDFSVFNILNQERRTDLDEKFERPTGNRNNGFLQGTGYQSPRYAQLKVSVDF
jgi:hypothetical protein